MILRRIDQGGCYRGSRPNNAKGRKCVVPVFPLPLQTYDKRAAEVDALRKRAQTILVNQTERDNK